MGRKSIQENKNIYFQTRYDLDISRELTSEKTGISEDRLARIENGTLADPEEICALAKYYKKPELKNYYCRNECKIGLKPEETIKYKDLSNIVLEMLAALNSVNKEKDRMIEITLDDNISDKELKEFAEIRQNLNHLSLGVEALKIWVEQKIDEGTIDENKLKEYMQAHEK